MEGRGPPREEPDARDAQRPRGIPRPGLPHRTTVREYIPIALVGALAGLIFLPLFLLTRFVVWFSRVTHRAPAGKPQSSPPPQINPPRS